MTSWRAPLAGAAQQQRCCNHRIWADPSGSSVATIKQVWIYNEQMRQWQQDGATLTGHTGGQPCGAVLQTACVLGLQTCMRVALSCTQPEAACLCIAPAVRVALPMRMLMPTARCARAPKPWPAQMSTHRPRHLPAMSVGSPRPFHRLGAGRGVGPQLWAAHEHAGQRGPGRQGAGVDGAAGG